MMTKAELRRSLLQQRRGLPFEIWQQQSQQLCSHLQASALLTQAKTILAYFSIRQEPDLSHLFEQDKTWGFPRCEGQEMVWHIWSRDSQSALQVGAFGIQEPSPDAPLLEVEQIDLMLIPAVACDRQGYRLGYGGGFYDRLLAKPEWMKIPTIGITFDFAHLQKLPVDDWDQPLTGICTEAGLFLITESPTE